MYRCTLASLLFALLACSSAVVCFAAVPPTTSVKLIAESGKPPYGSAHTPGVNALDLAQYGYIEEEYFLSGNASARDERGTITAAGESYTTRILVRRPSKRRNFSGTVVVTPFNWDRESAREWGFSKQYLARSGDAFVGISLVKQQIAGFPLQNGIKLLQDYDPIRYGALHVYDDHNDTRQEMAQSQDILAQLAWLLKSSVVTGPLKDLQVRRIIAYSLGVGGAVLEGYIGQGRHDEFRTPTGQPLYDGYIVGSNPLLPIPAEAQRGDAVFVLIQNEREFHRDTAAGLTIPADSDVPRFRLYDFVGAPHLGRVTSNAATGASELGNDVPEVAKAKAPSGVSAQICSMHNDAPVGLVHSALLHAIKAWLNSDTVMPRAPRVEVAGGDSGEKLDPQTGNALGGLRPPWIEVPAATYYSGASQGCGVWEPMRRFDAATLGKLYGDYAHYARLFTAARSRFTKAGFLLPEDAKALRPVARPEDFNMNVGKQ
jgi:hypothetical protein